VSGDVRVYGDRIFMVGPGNEYTDLVLELGNTTPGTGQRWNLSSHGSDGTFFIGRPFAGPALTITPSDYVGIGTMDPNERLTVSGNLEVYGDLIELLDQAMSIPTWS